MITGEAMILAWLFIISSIGFILYFVWYLTWPVVRGEVTDVRCGISDISYVRGRRKYRLVSYEYSYLGRTYSSARQGLFVGAALGPRKQAGDMIKVSVCRSVPDLSCPSRPTFEALILIAILSLLLSVAGLYMFP